MPEIGATLRETRMRQRIDITDMEVRTKIRAKYLRALENEEWDLLPGPTYVKSFLRTYAEALGLDPKALVEEYKLRHERLDTGDLHPIRPATQRGNGRRRAPGPGIPRWAVVGIVLLLILGALSLIGQTSDEDEPDGAGQPPPGETVEERGGLTDELREEAPPRPRRVRLTVAPTANVWVCLENGGGDRLIPGTEILPGTTRTFTARRFRITLGNGSVRLRVDGRLFQPPQSAEPQGYEFTRDGRRALGEDERPTCAGTP
ncbi:MAG TPA: helix-turn-helix domain-containing protein [Solirubrobacteraceae bacterium]|nr:helix-turn-helix domain-containing protein [Solirubrobacteraceae bacterium]